MDKSCEWCGKSLKVATTGRPKKFCNQTCRKASNRGLGVPMELRVKDRWLRHYKKRPITVEGRAASVTNETTWAKYEDARASTVGHGLGFVLGEGIGCIDLDDVICEDGNLQVGAQEILDQLPPTWIEFSPSGRGLHVWGRMPEQPGKVTRRNGVSVERYSKGRYITVTGKRWEGSPMILADLTAFIA